MLMERDRNIIKFLEKYRGLTIKQATRLFFPSYSYAQKRLKLLEEEGLIRNHFNKILNEKVYTLQDKISTHDLYAIELYTRLIELGCTIEEFSVQYKVFKDQLRPDCFISFVYEKQMHFYFLEVEDTHYTTMSKFQTYEMFFKTGEQQEVCRQIAINYLIKKGKKQSEVQNIEGSFPDIIVLGFTPIRYETENFGTIYMDFNELKDRKFIKKII